MNSILITSTPPSFSLKLHSRVINANASTGLHFSVTRKLSPHSEVRQLQRCGVGGTEGVSLATAFTLTLLNPATALAAGIDDPLCIGFAGDKTYTIVVVACVLQAIALVGAAVGGTLARQRKLEVEKINAQLRQIFAKMRRQYQVETYAPSLTYAPAPASVGRIQEPQSNVFVDPGKEELIKHLKAGKRYLREKNPQAAFDEFQQSLLLAKERNNRVEEKKAARGLGASCQRQGKFREAIKYHTMVLTISHLTGEHSGYTEALGAIADCYTELGDLENAARFYDQYIARLENDD